MTAISTAAVRHGSLPPATPTGHRFAPTAVPLGLAALAEAITDRTATVAVVGFGYVGLPLLVTAGAEGFRLIGIDADADKVRGLRSGRSHVADISPEDLGGQRDGDVRLGSIPLSEQMLADADCVVILTAHPDIDYGAVVRVAPLVFDASGVTRHCRADHVVLI
jgi:UDP-N-acetyl-D-mannosaminuronate dehydrogenase